MKIISESICHRYWYPAVKRNYNVYFLIAPHKVEVVGNSEPKVSGELTPDHVVENTVEIDTNAQSTTITVSLPILQLP